jgi:hypothetical protein
MQHGRPHLGWRLLSIVAGLLAAGVVINMVRAVFAGELVLLVPATLALLFWYWIAMGAHRRAVVRGEPSE